MLSELSQGYSLGVALGVSVVFAAVFIRARLNYLGIPKLPERAPGKSAPDCMVIVPARNEEARIARVVNSFPHDTVIVVDDHSEDGTAKAAREAGAGVLLAPDLQAQAIGKSNACAAGARLLRSKWMLFTDADTSFEEGFLENAVACAEANGLSFLSIYLRPEYEGFAENVIVPCAVALYFCGASTRGDATALFNGQCVLVRREAYEFIGGHTTVVTSLIEDVKLAALAQRHRMKFATVRADRLGHIRYHPDGLWDGFERNAFRFVMISPWIGITIVAAACIAALWLPVLVWLFMAKHWATAGVFALLPWAVLGIWYPNPGRAMLAPLGMYGMFFVILNGFFSAITGSRIEWKGREV